MIKWTRFLALVLLLSMALSLNAGEKGKVYLVLGSDTSIWEGLSTSIYDNRYFKAALYSDPTRSAYGVMDSTFRDQFVDSYGTPFKMTWWMMAGNVFDMSKNCNIPIRTNITLYLMKKYHQAALNSWDDQLSLHYHTYNWSDPQGDGIYRWERAEKFLLNLDDYERTLCTFLIEDDVFPVSFRSGWMYMDEDWQDYQERFIPFDMSDCWSTLSDGSAPFHPSQENYREEGDMKQWRVRSVYFTMPDQLKKGLESVFTHAAEGDDQMLCLWSHLPENGFLAYIDSLDRISHTLSQRHDVDFQYCTDVEAMRHWIAEEDTVAPKMYVSRIQEGNGLKLRISTDGPIFQEAGPFIAAKDYYEDYRRLDCIALGNNTWESLDFISSETFSNISISLCDSVGNQANYHINFAPKDIYVDDHSEDYHEKKGNWEDYTQECELWDLEARVLTGPGKLLLTPTIAESRPYALYLHAPGASSDSVRMIVSNTSINDTMIFNERMEGRDQWQFSGFYDLKAGEENTIQIENLDSSLALGFDVLRVTPLISDKNLNLNKNAIYFGDVSVMDTAYQTLILANHGKEPILIDQFSVFGSKVITDIEAPFVLNAMEKKIVNLSFGSESFCEYNDILTISSDDTRQAMHYLPIFASSNTYYQVVDNEDEENYFESGNWATSSSKSWGESSRYTYIGNTHKYADFTQELKYSGSYEVQFLIPASSNCHNHANYIIMVDGQAIDTLIVDQNSLQTAWRSLGEYDFPKDIPIVVRVQDNGGNTQVGGIVLRTDAIKFILKEEKFVSSIDYCGIPEKFELFQNYPNPFNPSTEIYFALDEASQVTIEFYNIQGKKVDSPIKKFMEAGYHHLQWTPKNLASGTYIYKLSTTADVAVNKCTLIK